MHVTSREIRRRVGHPVVDFDGHVIEFLPAAWPYLRESLGAERFEVYRARTAGGDRSIRGVAAETARRASRSPQSAWWGSPARNSLDLATAALPELLYERLDEMGIDYALLYPTKALGAARSDDPEMRQGICRGWNTFYAETFGPYADRFAAGGIIPMHTPAEAIAEIERCAALGLKIVAIPEGVWRPIAQPDPEPSPWLAPGQTHWFDNFGLDSEHDYDPVWQCLVDHGYPLVSHGGLGHIAPNQYLSITNYSANHIGSFRDKMFQLCKSLYFGGVTRRFPTLNLAFLECGAAWAGTLIADIVEHWEKRNVGALADLDPAVIDYDVIEAQFRKHGARFLEGIDDVRGALGLLPTPGVPPENRDDWRFLQVSSEDELVELFSPRMFFGCEADDRTVAFAFSTANAGNRPLRPVFSSDIAHWDVPDMADVVAESYELVTDGLITEDQYRDFVFVNPMEALLGANPSFFDGTALESAAREHLGTSPR
jgi:predicted TIM-barrel fold metal-dependent hydrolase